MPSLCHADLLVSIIVIHSKQSLNDLPSAGISLALDVPDSEFGIFLTVFLSVQELIPGVSRQSRSNMAIHHAHAALQELFCCHQWTWKLFFFLGFGNSQRRPARTVKSSCSSNDSTFYPVEISSRRKIAGRQRPTDVRGQIHFRWQGQLSEIPPHENISAGALDQNHLPHQKGSSLQPAGCHRWPARSTRSNHFLHLVPITIFKC